MRVLAVLVGYLAAALVLGALASYPLYVLLEPVAEVRFHKLVSRAGLLTALLGFPFLVKYLGVGSRRALGFEISLTAFSARVLVGWLLGMLMLLVVSWTLVALQVRIPATDVSTAWLMGLWVAGKGLASGLLVALIEETFFRGAAYSAIARRHTAGEAAIFSSLLYAAVHFVKPLPVSFAEGSSWFLGAITLGQALWPFTEPGRFVGSFLALFAAGVFLSLVRRHSGHIAYCIGLHAGWVTVIKVTKHFTDGNADSSLAYLGGAYDGITGLLAAVWVAAVGLVFWLRVKGRRAQAEAARSSTTPP